MPGYKGINRGTRVLARVSVPGYKGISKGISFGVQGISVGVQGY